MATAWTTDRVCRLCKLYFTPMSTGLHRDSLDRALAARGALIAQLREDGTDCFRVFHGTQEGAPGITLDGYGGLALLQSFHASLSDDEIDTVGAFVDEKLGAVDLVYNDRSGRGSRIRNPLAGPEAAKGDRTHVVREHGARYAIKARHRGQDPWLFLDLRPARKALASEADGKSVLNLFAYTCGAGVAAAHGGADRVLNVDFARSALDVGARNADLNGAAKICTQLQSDFFPAVRQLAGIRQPPVVRGRRLPGFPRVERESFDIAFLDPPRFAKSRFGVVDVMRDYPSLLKPVLGAVADGGVVYCTNNAARVSEVDWHDVIRRCAEKHGRPVKNLDVIRPGDDFPSTDAKPPLKIARLEI